MYQESKKRAFVTCWHRVSIQCITVAFVWLLLVIGTPAYCYFWETPSSASPVLMFLLFATAIVSITLALAGIVWGISRRSLVWLGLTLCVVVVAPLFVHIMGDINEERTALALAVAQKELRQCEPAAGEVATLLNSSFEVHSLFFLVRTQSGRLFGVQLHEHGRAFTLKHLEERNPSNPKEAL